MRKFISILVLLFPVFMGYGQRQTQQALSVLQPVETFRWNTPDGLPYTPGFSGNYSVETFHFTGQNRIAFLSKSKHAILIFNAATGTKEKVLSLPFLPVDFNFSNGKYYVAGTQNMYALNNNGTILKQWPLPPSLLFVNNIKVIGQKVYLLTAGQKTWTFNTPSMRWENHDGLILNGNWYGKVLKTGNYAYRIVLSGKGEALFTKSFRVEKPLGTLRIIGMQNNLLFVEIQTIENQIPLKVKREIKIFRWNNGQLSPVSALTLPDVAYTYVKHDITVSKNGLNVFVTTPQKAGLYQMQLENVKSIPQLKLPQPLYREHYLYNNHLLPAMESNPPVLKSVEITPIKRQKILQNAEPYVPHKWYCHPANIWDRDCGGVHVKTPSWVTVGNNVSVPYMWGGFSTIKQFDQGIANGVSAGDCDTHGNGAGSSCAVGVDCSGFVSRAWGLGTKYSTRSIPSISTQYPSYNDLKPGDVVNYAGHHVRLIHTVYDNGSFLIIEAAASSTDWRVGYNSYSVADFQGRYLPRRFNKVIEGQVDDTPPVTSVNVKSWETGNFQVHFSDKDNVKVTQRYYHVGYFDGTQWSANEKNGFFKDHFSTRLSPQWNIQTGTWYLHSGILTQSDENNANTNIYAYVTQNAGKYDFLYHWKMKIGGAGDNRRAGIVFMSDNPTLSQRNNAYMVYFRVDQNTCQIYKSENNHIDLKTSDACPVGPNEWFDAKVIFHVATGEIDVFKNDTLVSTWIDPSPLTSGNSLSLRTGNARVSYKDITMYRSRGTTAEVSTGSGGDAPYENQSPGQPACRIFSIVSDSMHNLSAVDTAWVNIDTSKPSNFTVYDGLNNEMDSTEDNSQISARWTPSSDPNSGIMGYFYAVGTASRDSNILSWSDNGTDTVFIRKGLSLERGKTYYVSVVAINRAGLSSDTLSSDGFKVLQPTGIPVTGKNKFAVYPVPARQTLWIEPGNAPLTAAPELYNLAGKKLQVRCSKASDKLWKMEIKSLPAGMYLIKIPAPGGMHTQKIIISR